MTPSYFEIIQVVPSEISACALTSHKRWVTHKATETAFSEYSGELKRPVEGVILPRRSYRPLGVLVRERFPCRVVNQRLLVVAETSMGTFVAQAIVLPGRDDVAQPAGETQVFYVARRNLMEPFHQVGEVVFQAGQGQLLARLVEH